MPADRSQRPETLPTSQRPRAVANQAAISDERPKPLRDHRNSAACPEPAPRGSRLRAEATRSAGGARGRKVVRHKARPKSAAAPIQEVDTSLQAGSSPVAAPNRSAAPSRVLGSRRSSPDPIPGDASRPGVVAPDRTVPSRSRNRPLLQRELPLMRRRGRPGWLRSTLLLPQPQVRVAMVFVSRIYSLHYPVVQCISTLSRLLGNANNVRLRSAVTC